MSTLDAIVRVSRVGGREGDSFISPDVQRKQIVSYCETYGLTIGNWYEELDVSGGTTNRKLLNEAMARVESGESGGIIVAKLDRFARNVKEGLDSIERIANADGRFICVEQQFDTGSPQGKFFLTLMLAFAELERANRKEGFKVAKGEAVGRGVHISAFAPTGYMKPGKGQRLVLDPLAWEHVYEVGIRRIAGTSWKLLADYLNEVNVRSGQGDLWVPHSVRRMLQNPAYMGHARNGEFSYADAHPAIFTPAEFAAIQATMNTTEYHLRSGPAKTAALRGIAKCGTCENNMTIKRVSNKKVVVYSCITNRGNKGRCPAGATMTVARLEEYVEAQLIAAFDGESELARGLEAAQKLQETERALDEARTARDAYLRNTTLLSILGEDKYNETVREYQRAVQLAEMERDDALGQSRLQNAVLTHDLLDAWQAGELTVEERHTVMAALLDRVVVATSKGRGTTDVAKRVTIVLRGNVLLTPRSVAVETE